MDWRASFMQWAIRMGRMVEEVTDFIDWNRMALF
jgi:hypothetical protein